MRDLASLEERIDHLVAASDQEREVRQQATSAEMASLDAANAAFIRAAARLQSEVVVPRVESIVRRFPPAVVDHLETPDGVHVRCLFPRSDRFPATVTLTVGLLHDRDRGVASVFHSVEVVPMLRPFDRGAHQDLAIGAAARGEVDDVVATFVDEALLRFLHHYLSLEYDPQYQRASASLDPVCRMSVSAASAAATLIHARTQYYFCSTTCRDSFLADPDAYLRRPMQLQD